MVPMIPVGAPRPELADARPLVQTNGVRPMPAAFNLKSVTKDVGRSAPSKISTFGLKFVAVQATFSEPFAPIEKD
ncbi:hypothetical protein [Mesorhizobium retamae]|uniref:Uncharacterized protein n=1 Tax=Mesorhizobium retamae TaxID=2912854 RepID=A0ABS9Q9U7_9HYPH|nr:hypothetical protein [Mesorhizobium sp. IRAMC:0171]MCG7504189.1 hypothetical protein [Mesorhizobium sp. IRAMC:0171]